MRVCRQEWSEPLSAWVDGEVGSEEGARVEAHLARCAACAATVRAHRALGAAMRARTDDEVPPRVMARARGLAMRRRRWAWAAVAAVAVAAASMLALRPPASRLEETLAQELVTHHLRGFAREQPCELESDDPVAVRSWVEERLGYEVEVPQPEGVTLIGARACSLGGRRTAALLYRCEGAPMTLFVPPPGSEALSCAESFASSGARCTEGPMGERICVSGTASRPAFAVADLPDEQVMSLLPR